MATSPRSASPASVQMTEQGVLTTKDFRDYVKDVARGWADLVATAKKVATLEKGQAIRLADGSEVNSATVKSLQSRMTAITKGLAKSYAALAKSKKKRAVTAGSRRGGGFANPIRVTDELREFFKTAELGYIGGVTRKNNVKRTPEAITANPNDPANGRLVDVLGLLTERGVTSPSLLTPLFSIYALVNNLQDPEHHNMLHADAHMNRYLGEALARAEAEVKAHITPKGKQMPAFDRNAFPYTYVQYITKFSKPAMSKDERKLETKTLMDQPGVMERLREEQQVVSDTLAAHKLLKAPEDQAHRKALKQQSRARQ